MLFFFFFLKGGSHKLLWTLNLWGNFLLSGISPGRKMVSRILTGLRTRDSLTARYLFCVRVLPVYDEHSPGEHRTGMWNVFADSHPDEPGQTQQ